MELKEEQILLITKHLNGETSVEEKKLIANWLAENEQHKTAYKELEFLWNLDKNIEVETPNIDNAWKSVKQKAKIGKPNIREESKVRSLYNINTFMKIAASIILFAAAGYFTFNLFQKEELTIISTADNKKEITLPDGSKVWINKNSKLSYSSNNFNDEEREVSLEGEAFFEVTKNPDKPFIVNGQFSQTKVLGTSFDIRSIKNESSDKIQVFTGKVSFKGKDQKENNVFLLPGDMATTSQNGIVEKSKINTPNAIAWKSNKLLFDNSTLKEVVETTNNYFDTTNIIISNPEILNCRFTGSFSDPNIEEIVKVISISMNLSSTKSDSSYTLSGEGCK